MNITFFSTPTCIKCGKTKSYLGEQLAQMQIEHQIEHVDASTPQGLEKAKEMNVMSVPTVFFEKNEERIGIATDLDEIETILGKLK